MQELEKILEEIDKYITLYNTPPTGREVEGTVELLAQCKEIIRRHMKNEEDILKFYYCESEDDYYIGQRMQNMYYARYADGVFTWFMSRHLPWGKRVTAPKTAWKEYTYPTEPKEIPFMEWLEEFIRKHMNDGKCGECSRRKWYQKGYEDGKNNNDGWIPVEERLPEEDAVLVQVSGKPRKNITLENAYEFAEYAKGEGWILENYPDWENPEVHAWQPLPDPYCRERKEDRPV